MLRYRDGQVVSTKGERYSDVKPKVSEDMKKTYINLKPAKQYRFHWSMCVDFSISHVKSSLLKDKKLTLNFLSFGNLRWVTLDSLFWKTAR